MAVANLKNDYAYTYVCCDEAFLSMQGSSGSNSAIHVSVNAFLSISLIMYESKGGGIHPLIVTLVEKTYFNVSMNICKEESKGTE